MKRRRSQSESIHQMIAQDTHFDELTVRIGPAETSDFDDAVYVFVTVLVNGNALPDVLDVDKFFASLDAPNGTTARLPIFNCTCGCFGCGGFYTNVTLTPEALVWENSYYPSDDPGSAKRQPWQRWRYRFSWASVRDMVGEIIAAFYTAQAKCAEKQYVENCEVRYGATGVNMVERFPFYLKRYEALPE